jgi:hypothetical protein
MLGIGGGGGNMDDAFVSAGGLASTPSSRSVSVEGGFE